MKDALTRHLSVRAWPSPAARLGLALEIAGRNGDREFGATLRAVPAYAVAAPKGQRIRVHGQENMKPDP